MSYGAIAGGGAAAAAAGAAVIAQAIKASGAIVRVGPHDFNSILSKMDSPLVVVAESKFIKVTYRYLTAYKGLFFFTKSSSPLQFIHGVEAITAKKIWIPG